MCKLNSYLRIVLLPSKRILFISICNEIGVKCDQMVRRSDCLFQQTLLSYKVWLVLNNTAAAKTTCVTTSNPAIQEKVRRPKIAFLQDAFMHFGCPHSGLSVGNTMVCAVPPPNISSRITGRKKEIGFVMKGAGWLVSRWNVIRIKAFVMVLGSLRLRQLYTLTLYVWWFFSLVGKNNNHRSQMTCTIRWRQIMFLEFISLHTAYD